MSFDGLLYKFTAKEDDRHYFATFPSSKTLASEEPCEGTTVKAYSSIDDLVANASSKSVTVSKLLAPLPHTNVPLYCVGLNYRSHATEAKLDVPKYPPLWTKPATSLADPEEAIPVNNYCANSLLDFEGELVFVTSKTAKDITPAEAESYILGYTLGNDLSCRFFQLPKHSGGQFFYAKAFDKFAPIGPYLISPKNFDPTAKGVHLVTKVNGKVVQDCELANDMIFNPNTILSHMSQGTTIPAGTAIMTGTPAGVGAFQSPKSFLSDNDTIEVQIEGLGTLRNQVRFEK